MFGFPVTEVWRRRNQAGNLVRQKERLLHANVIGIVMGSGAGKEKKRIAPTLGAEEGR